MKTKLIFTVIALLAAITSAQADGTYINGLYYNLDAITRTAEVTCEKYNSYSNYSYISGELTIPETVTYNGTTYSVTSIDTDAFYGCSGLTSVTIPNSVTSIGSYAFYYCDGLTSVTIPNSVTSIGRAAFYECSSLMSVTIPNSVTSIDINAFYGCSSLTSVTIPNSVTSIGESAFYECSSLMSVTIPNSVTSIDTNAFYGCSGLTSVTIPNSVTNIGRGVFSGCSSLTTIIVKEGNTTYDSRNNCNAIIETATNTLICGCVNTIIPNSVTSIGRYAFYNRSSLTSVTIPNSVTIIEDFAFAWCENLTNITISKNVWDIRVNAFSNCKKLSSIYIYAYKPPYIAESSIFDVNTNTCVLYVPKESVEAYKKATVWKDFKRIVGVDVPEDTAIDDVFLQTNASNTQKVFIDGNVYLLTPDGRKLNMQGAEVK